jgi:hypothetical protein
MKVAVAVGSWERDTGCAAEKLAQSKFMLLWLIVWWHTDVYVIMMMASSLWKVAFAGQEGAEGVDHPSQRHPE